MDSEKKAEVLKTEWNFFEKLNWTFFFFFAPIAICFSICR